MIPIYFPWLGPKSIFSSWKKRISLARPSFVLHYSGVLSISHLKHAKFSALENDVYLCWNISIMYKSRVESMQILKYYVMYLQEWGLGLGGDSSEPVTWVHHSVVFIVTVLVVEDTPFGFVMFSKNYLMLLPELLIPYLDKWPVLKLHYCSEFPLLSPAPTLFQLLKWRKFPNNGGFWQYTADRTWAGSKQPNYGLHFNSFNYNVNATVVDADTSRIFSAQ